MRKVKRKIISGIIVAGCAVLSLGTYALVSNHEKGSVPVSLNYESEKPVIVLDAGHGESS